MRRFFEAARAYMRQTDAFLLTVTVISALYGLVLIISATRVTGGAYVLKQSVAIVLGVVFYIVVSLIDIEIVADKYKALIVLSALFITSLFIWGEAGDTGNRAWLQFFGFSVQPAEIVKIPFVIILARMVVSRRDRRMLNTVWSMTRLLGLFALFFLLIIQSSSDLGTALVYVFITVVMLYLGGVYLRWFAMGAAVIGAASPLIWTHLLSERQRNLIIILFDPQSVDPDGYRELWQTTKSLSAFSLGRLTGSGLFNGEYTQSTLIPKQHTDFIITAAGEELGFIGVIAVFALLLAIIIRCFYVGAKSNDRLGMLVCSGIAAMFIFQTLENIGMCLGLTPVIGITLPFFSYGGSSIITSFIAAGIVAGIKMRPKPSRYRLDY